ncbi:MAG: T9SS type A sorting domain-containing protein [Bacteroidales bacterium]|nr:T9SS type A sorting domain-containing protein [Bacteroidales bacterium]
MKTLLLLLSIITTMNSFAQDFKPLTSQSKKLFTHGAIADTTYSLMFDSISTTGTDSAFFPYYLVSPQFTFTDTCEFWGGTECKKQDSNIFIGEMVATNNQGIYRFCTNQGDSLIFDFNHTLGDSSVFFHNQNSTFFIIYEGADTATIMGFADSVQSYRIAHTDADGNVVNSALHDQKITIGKSIGLIDFFRIDYFPDLLQPLYLIGNKSPDLGWHAVTHEQLYDHQPGDIIQYKKIHYADPGPPWENYEIYTTKTFLERTDTPDSIFYKIAQFKINIDSAIGIYDTVITKYRKDNVFKQIPYDYIPHGINIEKKSFRQTNYCDLNLWTFKYVPEFLMYCSADNCWGSYDIPGPPPDITTIHVCGIGLYYDHNYTPNYPYAYTNDLNMVEYFKKNGIECGQYVPVNVPEHHSTPSKVFIFPNPADDYIEIYTAYEANGAAQLFSLNGRLITAFPLQNKHTKIDVSSIAPGMYVLKIVSGSEMHIEKMIVQ